MDRRDFIKSAAAMATAGTVLGATPALQASAASAPAQDTSKIRNYNPQMQYRRMGKANVHVSALGCGMLRLPMLEDKKTVNEQLTVDMVRYAIDNGVNYVDTAYYYLGGQSEAAVGKALQNGYRDKVYVTSKSPWFIMEKAEDFDRCLDESRKRLQTDVIDFYLIHMISNKGWNGNIGTFKLIEKIEKAKQQGKIRFSGFSYHDGLVLFKTVVDANPEWDFCQVQHNYLDFEYEAGVPGIKYAAGRGLGISIMEALRNGFLVNPPEKVKAVLAAANPKRTPVEWALDYLWDMPEISVVLTGFSAMQHIQENVASARRSSVGMLSFEDRVMFGEALKRYNEYDIVPCTGCYNCMPCPQDVGISYILAYLYNQYASTGNKMSSQRVYDGMAPILRGRKASACNDCGACLSKCPQQINIPEALKKARGVFEA